MPLINEVRTKIAIGEFEFSQHATDQSIVRFITVQEIREAVASGEVVEDYPSDKYGPSCLIFGFTDAQRPLHIQCTYPSLQPLKIITVYEPDPNRWINFRERKTGEM